MVTTWSKTAAFAHFGTAGKNPRWSWSGRSADGDTVAVTIWRDHMNYAAKPPVFSCFGKNTEAWANRAGNTERTENLIWARDHCGGRFRAVVCVAEDVKANPREIRSCFPADNFAMQLVELNEETGEFRAIVVPV